MSYSTLSTRRQVRILRQILLEMLKGYDLDVTKIKLVAHEFNTTFRVFAGDHSFAFRINTNSRREQGELNGEVEFVQHLHQSGRVHVPKPKARRDGSLVSNHFSEETGREMSGVMYEWLWGRDAKERWIPEVACILGKATRAMHELAHSYRPSAKAQFRLFPNLFFGQPYMMEDYGAKVDHSLLREVMARANLVYDRLIQNPLIATHSDLHYNNMKWYRGKLSIFDFDDSMLGLPVSDVFTTLFYIRSSEGEEAYWEGLGYSLDDLLVTPDELELLVTSRGLLLANELFRMENPELSEVAPRYAQITETRVRHFLDTGRFDPRVAMLK